MPTVPNGISQFEKDKVWALYGLENGQQVPPNAGYLGHLKRKKAPQIYRPRKHNEAPVLPTIRSDDLSSDRNADETCHRHEGISRSIIAPIVLCLAQPADAHGTDANVVAARKADQEHEEDDTRCRVARRQPDGETRDDGEDDGEHVGVERAELVSPPARERTAKDRSCVEDRKHVEGEVVVEPLV